MTTPRHGPPGHRSPGRKPNHTETIGDLQHRREVTGSEFGKDIVKFDEGPGGCTHWTGIPDNSKNKPLDDGSP